MAEHRAVEASRGAAWITQALASLRNDPAGYFGACLWVGLLSSLPLVSLLIGLVMPVFHAGLLSALRTRAEGGRAHPRQAFDGFAQPGALGRLLPIVAFNFVVAAVVVGVLLTAAWPALADLARAAQGGAQPPPELALAVLQRLLLPALVVVPLSIYVGWVLMLAIPRAMLDGVPGGLALRQASSAIGANLGAFAVNLLCLTALLVALTVLLAIPVLALAVVKAAAPTLAALLQVPVMAVFTGAVLALYCAMMFEAARDLFPTALAAAPPPPVGQIEA